MRSKLLQNWVLPPSWLRFLIIIILVLGLFFRFVNLDRKIYWMDETYTSLRISGYTEAEVAQQLLESQILSLQNLHQYQRINSEKSIVDTVKGLATEEPQLAPLYFILVRFWAQMFGDSVAAIRSFSAFLSVLALPCIYWLCLELFESSLVGWLACALLVISPFQLVYAQEARQYSLWTVAILLSSASLLRAIRINTWRSWGLYAVTVAVGVYSHLFFVLVAIAQAIYVFFINNYRWNKALKGYLLSSIVGIIAFSPWIVVILTNYKQALTMTAAQDTKTSLLYFLKSWLGNLSRNFIDTGFSSGSPFAVPWYHLVLPSLSILVITALVIYSLYFLARDSPKRAWLFIFLLIGFTSLVIIIPDLILGRRTSVTGRYMIPSYLGIQLSVSYLLGSKINPTLLSNRFHQFWKLILLALLTSGVISCVIISQSQTWWNNLTDTHNRQLAQIINQTSNPLVIQEIDSAPPRYNVFNLISLSYLLNPEVKFKFIPKNTTTKIPPKFSNIFFMAPSHVLQSGIEIDYQTKIEPIDGNPETRLWKLIKP
ncbi:glycosyltransferase family 39 protein [Allocoleopsis franciscana]|uniref:Putative membrane protein n=1 Tax=Allocoleopsis franciscana PCC 7113 TaxID=1173027 RepID=K9WHT0_9CYAN|nr:glycosyltransferase family 39 protein [Allocoleopsis franciscana]AFZ19339.1 putative membrane protein [Allocoleopsis franciscana PCC 7113]